VVKNTEHDVPTISLTLLLEALRWTPRGSRLRVLRSLFPYLSVPLQRSSAASCRFESLDEFATDYVELAALLGKAGKVPPPDEIEFLRAMLNRPEQYRGSVGPRDFFFLTAFVSILAPQRVLEIGTWTGFSAAIIAAAIHRQHQENGAVIVDTIDIRRECMPENARPTGFQIAELVPELASTIRLHLPCDSSIVGQLVEPNELEVAFIDADHRHPRPLLDLVRLVPYVQTGGWIVLHDIQLGTSGRRALEEGRALPWPAVFGAEWLFEYWPFGKISCGNIGAIQLPAENAEVVPFILRMMSLRFEIDGDKPVRRTQAALYQNLSRLL